MTDEQYRQLTTTEPRGFTIRDLYADPARMAEFMGWPFEDEQKHQHTWNGYGTGRMVTISAVDAVSERVSAYRSDLFAAWLKSKDNPHKPLTHRQEVARWIKEEFGPMRGTLEDKLFVLRGKRRDIYAEPGKPVRIPTGPTTVGDWTWDTVKADWVKTTEQNASAAA